jgi:hypothetical protein
VGGGVAGGRPPPPPKKRIKLTPLPVARGGRRGWGVKEQQPRMIKPRML